MCSFSGIAYPSLGSLEENLQISQISNLILRNTPNFSNEKEICNNVFKIESFICKKIN